jgi:hypothetical protein
MTMIANRDGFEGSAVYPFLRDLVRNADDLLLGEAAQFPAVRNHPSGQYIAERKLLII